MSQLSAKMDKGRKFLEKLNRRKADPTYSIPPLNSGFSQPSLLAFAMHLR